MKLTLLDIVQRVLSEMDGDNVNSIGDTIEATQVADLVRDVYMGMIADKDWPHLHRVMPVDGLADPNRPTYLQLPDNVDKITRVMYDTGAPDEDATYKELRYLTPGEFIIMQNSRDENLAENQLVSDFTGVDFVVGLDKAPDFWTSFDDTYLILDSVDQSVEATVHQNKTLCEGYIIPSWTTSDSFIPDLPAKLFSLLLEEVKGRAFYSFKQMRNQYAEMNARKGRIRMRKEKFRTDGEYDYPNYGRKKMTTEITEEMQAVLDNPVPGGRTLEVVAIVNTSLYGLRFKEGGTLPAHLDGAMFTTPDKAQEAADAYVATFKAKQAKMEEKKAKKDK
jgi:hypothetical protein